MTTQTLTITIDSDDNEMVVAMDFVKEAIEQGATSGIIGWSSDSWELTTEED